MLDGQVQSVPSNSVATDEKTAAVRQFGRNGSSMTTLRSNLRHVVIIGAGILGASIAWRISVRGFPVTLIDKSAPGSGASSHSFAWINASSKQPIGYHNLNRRSLEMWSRFASELSDDGDGKSIGLRWGGKVTWATNPAAAARLISEVRRLQSWGYPIRLINAAELSELEPTLAVGPVAAAEYSENEGQVEPQLVIDACLRRLKERNATVCRDTEVAGFRLDREGQVVAVETTSGRIACDTVVLAAGIDTTVLAAKIGVYVPQVRSPGVVIRTTPMQPLLQNVSVVYAPSIAAGGPEVHIRQCADGRMMLGEGNQESLAQDDSQAHADDILERACHYLPDLAAAKAIPVPVGWRPMPQDGYPVVGFPTEAPNLYVALTHSGITLAPVLSQLAALEICEGVPADAVLGPYRPQRFAARTTE